MSPQRIHTAWRCLLILLVSQLHCPAAAELRGVNPRFSDRFDSATHKTFECGGGSAETISFDRVNDDFCDCPNGSDEPGTSACYGGSFFCLDRGYPESNHTIPAHAVDDGVCDCCDGSDEQPSAGCKDNCGEKAKRAAVDEMRNDALWEHVTMVRKKYISTAADMPQRRNAAKDIPLLKQQFDQYSHYFTKMRSKLQKSRKKRSSQKLMGEFTKIWKMMNEAKANYEFAMQVAQGDYGPDDVYLTLAFGCWIKLKVNEKELKGGTSNASPRTYAYRVCPFHNVTQFEPPNYYTEWALEQARSKAGVDQNATHVGGLDPRLIKARAYRETPDSVNLGYYQGWVNATEGAVPPTPLNGAYEAAPAVRAHTRNHYGGGEACPGNVHRSVALRFACGIATAVASVVEDGACQYKILMTTPAACTRAARAAGEKVMELAGYGPQLTVEPATKRGQEEL